MTKKSSLVALGLAAALALTGCAGGGNNGGNAGEGKAGAALTIAKPDGAIATESNNPWVGDSSALKLGYINSILEPLALINLANPSEAATPWLAEKVEWSEDYKSVTVTARDGVKWNDGKDFTAADIAYTFQMFLDHPALDIDAMGLTKVTEDGNKVTLDFENSMFVKQEKVLHKRIVPKHIYEGVKDPATYDFKEAVGTGPYKLTKFDTQSVELTARDDYWGGKLAVPKLYYVSYNDNTALTTALANGDADWAQAFIPNVKSAFLDKDPEHNVQWAAAGLGIDAMYVNTTKAPFNNLAFRQAVNDVIDRHKHQEVAREGAVPAIKSITGLPTPAGDPFIQEEYKGKDYKVDVDAAKKILTDAGYTGVGTKLVDPQGQPVSFTISVPQGWNDYVTGISLIADSVKALGAEAKVNTPDSDTWWDNKGKGDFDAILHWTDTGATPYNIYNNTMGGMYLKPIGEQADFNFGRYDNPEATAQLAEYANATDDAARTAALDKVQQIFVNDVPAMPIGTRPYIGSYNTRNYVGWPNEKDPYAPADPTQVNSVLILTKLKAAAK
ncbi:peptide/nickel transport system substrate-binding protein [Mycetocola sp. BIGb0189]|uniref:ABC transporter substrate-binding protein n=1 Tax=Mycetocola sp. BIGb0189 TaxID=2940604 RepID=UPI002169B504|nr:ABC transporter substrate-binding protein [Mycetocola sp. BIGb0189]MCS4277484.1 peptide/nickel transport system substrate-binding protein [Mycetocola sp. BIGb0189]